MSCGSRRLSASVSNTSPPPTGFVRTVRGIPTLLWVLWRTLRRDKTALFLAFVLPMVFFSIFATIFGARSGGGGGATLRPIELRIVDLDNSGASRALVASLAGNEALAVREDPELPDGATTLGETERRDAAFLAVRSGDIAAALLIPPGFADQLGALAGTPPQFEVIYDASNPMAQHTIGGLVQAAVMQAAPSRLMETGMEFLDTFGGGLTDEQKAAFEAAQPMLQGQGALDAGGTAGAMAGLVDVTSTAAHADDDEKQPSMASYYAAGFGVMFLLFSITGAASGLLDEAELGTLERLLSSSATMGTLLGAYWAWFTAIGILQVLLMFVWGALVFDVDLFTAPHFVGCLVMAVVTAGAASAFALMLAALAKTRAQLNGMATILILIMSALGGSMVPRYIMPSFLEPLSRFTFNGWALDGFLDVFWYDAPGAGVLDILRSIAPEVAMMCLIGATLMAVARCLARRWETT